MQNSKTLSNNEAAAFAGQMHLILKAGIPAISGMIIMRDDADDEATRDLLNAVIEGMNQTGFLYTALKNSGAFPDYMVHMVKIGEQTGNLDSVMESLSEHYTRQEEMRRNRVHAIVYPVVLTGIMLAVVLVLLAEVMPVFDQVFQDLGTSLSGFSLILLHIGNGIRTGTLIIVIIVAAALVCILLFNVTKIGRKLLLKIQRHFPGSRVIIHDTAASEFASTMSMALSSGLSPEQSLDLAIELIDDPAEKNNLKAVRQDVTNSVGLTESLLQRKIFRGVYAHMAAIGEKTGTLDQVFSNIADLYSEELEEKVSRRMARFEPILVIILSILVGVILLSVMFPLLGIMSGL